MRILYLIRDFNFGGAENHVSDLANAMDSPGNTVYILSSHGNQETRLKKGIHFTKLRIRDFFLLPQLIYVCFFIYRNKIEIIHAHKRSGINLGCYAGRIMRIPVIATVHGRPRHDLRSKISQKLSDKLIFVSKRTMSANIGNPNFAHKSVLIHNGIATIKDIEPKDPFSVTYLSRIDRKHFQLISKLVKEIIPALVHDFGSLTLHIVGEGPCSGQLSKEVAEINAVLSREVCIIHGYLPEVAAIVKRSGLLLGVGRCAMEGISCSTAVLPVNSKYLGNFINAGNYLSYEENNFVPVGMNPPDSGLLESRLREYLNKPEWFLSTASEIATIINERLAMDVIAKKIFSVYLEAKALK